ncbi:MAG TPA: acyl--CoA ligase [Myxococcaceae bacterium]|nr:acyl--CoA ligase [Myxococcaceae bacterium]
MSQPATIAELLDAGAPEASAVGAPEGVPPLRYRDLQSLARRTTEMLNALGIGRNDRVAIVLPNGPEMATVFVCIAAGAATAPLNPAYRADELEFYLTDLKAKALVLETGSDSPARSVARKLGVPVLELTAHRDRGAGTFSLAPVEPMSGSPARGGPGSSDDAALLLHTSGTTSRPKLVPLLQRNVLASARHIGATLSLTPADVCLNIMPLFHIHGLIAATLSSLAAGGQVCCSPGFNALKFFAWLDEVKPTWYTAVPTMHQAILARADRNQDIVARSRLRFIRSSSASLPPQVMSELEKTFRTPVIESYGMTEAAHQMASNPLPPRPRKPGSVGIAAGPEVGIMDEAGKLLARGATGEVVIRGPNVTPGYEANPDANAKAFTAGWFRTGDQGLLDEDGYLRLTGRLKELINRGGEKISPLEVDEVLMDHPAVAQVVTFGMPHDKLGEEVAAAVVLREGKTASDRELRDFCAARLADFKVPRKIVVLAEIPKGATGKLQRIGLAAKLGLGS